MAQRLNIDIVARDKSKQALTGLKKNLSGLKNSIFNLRNAFIGLGAGLVIRSIINTGKQIEGLQVRLKFLFGTAQEGAKAFDEMAKFASKVPFSLEEIQAGASVLAVVSKDAKEMAKLMKITGNVAAVTGLDFKTTAEQIQRSMSAGISAADLFRDRGVKDMLGFKAGATASVEETAAAFDRVFGEGGKFDGATDELAKTFEGTLSMIGDKVFNFKRVLLDAGFFSQLKKQFGDLNKSMEQNSEALDKIAVTIGTVLAIAVEKVANGIKFLADHSRELGIAFKVLVSLKIGFMLIRRGRALIPIVASMRALASLTLIGIAGVAASVAAAGLTYKLLGDQLDNVEKKINKNFEAQKKVINPFEETRQTVVKINEEAKKLNNEFEKAFNTNRITRSHDAMHSMMNETTEQSKTLKEVFSEMNKNELDNFATKFKEIKTTIAEGINVGIRDFSNSLARAVILGENLAESFKRIAQDLAIKLLSITIEIVLRKQIELILEKQKTEEKKKQLKIQMAMMAMSGNPMALLGFAAMASGGSVSKGKPVLVGERGAELFVPNSSGQIQQNARGTGGGSVNVNFNIEAIDSSSFSNVLVENRGIITSIINNALNEKGRRELI